MLNARVRCITMNRPNVISSACLQIVCRCSISASAFVKRKTVVDRLSMSERRHRLSTRSMSLSTTFRVTARERGPKNQSPVSTSPPEPRTRTSPVRASKAADSSSSSSRRRRRRPPANSRENRTRRRRRRHRCSRHRRRRTRRNTAQQRYSSKDSKTLLVLADRRYSSVVVRARPIHVYGKVVIL